MIASTWSLALGNISTQSKHCTSCGELKTMPEYYWRTARSGEKVRRSQCRVCVNKKQGNPGKRVRPS